MRAHPDPHPEPHVLKMIRDARIDFRTGVVIIALALAAWAAVVYLNARDMVPAEFREAPAEAPDAVP